MDQTPKILRLSNGKTLIGLVETNTGQFEISKPLEMVHVLDLEQKHESVSLKPWVFFADEETFTIKPQHVISSATLQPEYHSMYFEVSERAYDKDSYEPAFEEADVFDEEFREDVFQDALDEALQMLLSVKDDETTIH